MAQACGGGGGGGGGTLADELELVLGEHGREEREVPCTQARRLPRLHSVEAVGLDPGKHGIPLPRIVRTVHPPQATNQLE